MVEKRLENSFHYEGEGFRIAPETTEIFKYSIDKARSEGRRVIEAGDICFVLAASKNSLLDDILQNPEGSVSTFKKSRISTEEKQNYFLSKSQIKSSSFPQLQNKPSKFLTEFSLRELVEKNLSTTGLLFTKTGGGGIGVGSSIETAEQTVHNKHETSGFWIKEDFGKFNEEEFFFSLRKDVEDSIYQSGLKITESDISNLSSFHFEYENGRMKGNIDISGGVTDDSYKLKATIVEKSIQKTTQ